MNSHNNPIKTCTPIKLLRLGELVMTILLLAFLIYRCNYRFACSIDMAELSSDVTNFDEASRVWKVNAADIEEGLEKGTTMTYGPYMQLGIGSYTVKIHYDSDVLATARLNSNTVPDFVHGNTFYLSKNLNEVEYDFWLTREAEDLEVVLMYGGEGDFTLSGIEIEENVHAAAIPLFIWLLAVAVGNIIVRLERSRRRQFLAVMGIALATSIPLFTYGFTTGHDISFHLQRIEGIAEGLKTGQFPAKMASTYNDGYGYPVSVYYGDLLLYVPALLRVIGFSVSTAYKAYIFLVNLLTAATATYCCKQMFSERIAYMAAAAYLFGNYRLENIYVRSAVGEYTAMIFFPVIALAIYWIYQSGEEVREQTRTNVLVRGGSARNALTLAIGMLGLLYTHILSTSMVTVVLVAVALVFWKRTFRKEVLVTYVLAVVLVLIGGMAFYVPFLDYYLNVDTLINQSGESIMHIQRAGSGLIDFFTFFKKAAGDGSTAVVTDRMQLTPGPVLMLGLIGGIVMWIKGRASKRLRFYTVLSLVLLFLASNLFPWNYFAEVTKLGSFMSRIQFPWRYIALAMVVMMLLLGQVLSEASLAEETKAAAKYYALAGLMLCAYFSSAYSNGYGQAFFIDREEISWYTDVETDPWLAGVEYVLVGTHIGSIDHEVHAEHSQATIVSESGVDLELYVSVNEEGDSIGIPRFSYPNYVATDDDGRELALVAGDNNTISILIPSAYEGGITVRYVEPWYWRAAETISFAFAAGVMVWYLNRRIASTRSAK